MSKTCSPEYEYGLDNGFVVYDGDFGLPQENEIIVATQTHCDFCRCYVLPDLDSMRIHRKKCKK